MPTPLAREMFAPVPQLATAPKKEHPITAQLLRCAGAIANLLKGRLSHLEWVLQSLVSYIEILPDGGVRTPYVLSLARRESGRANFLLS